MIDPKDYPKDKLFMTREQVQEMNPHRFEFAQLDGVLHFDPEENLFVGLRDVREDEFWVRGHIPGRPIFPGVLMCEVLAQSASIHAQILMEPADDVFIGFGALDSVRFKEQVDPGTTLWVVGKMIRLSSKRAYFKWDGALLREDGTTVCEGSVTGIGF